MTPLSWHFVDDGCFALFQCELWPPFIKNIPKVMLRSVRSSVKVKQSSRVIVR